MIQTRGYYDLCLNESFFVSEKLERNLLALYDYGYRTIALNQTVDGDNVTNEPKKKKKKGDPRETQDILSEPINLEMIEKTVEKLGFQNFKVFNRLTVVFSNQDALYKIMKSPNFKKYQIIAAAPTTMQAFTYTCGTLEADIFTFDPENKFGLRMNRKYYEQLRNRKYHIELQYSHAIEDSTKRKHLIHASHLFHAYGKSKNIIISSGAHRLEYVRNAYDIINLGFLFGLSQLQCKIAVMDGPKTVILNSIGRRQGKAVMFVEEIMEEESQCTKEDVIMIETSDEDMDCDQPKSKKTKL